MDNSPAELGLGWRIIILLAAMSPEFANLFFSLRRAVRGHGASGIPFVWSIIFILVLLSSGKPILIPGKPALLFQMIDVVFIAVLSVSINLLIPLGFAKWLQRRGRKNETSDDIPGSDSF
jgi:hypothetical protein